jgi:hypothetical protein
MTGPVFFCFVLAMLSHKLDEQINSRKRKCQDLF